MTESDDLFAEGYTKALEALRACGSEDGFLSSPSDSSNYRRVWGRDGSILTLAALLSGDEDLIETGRRTLLTLVEHQGPHGEIPSNVDKACGRVSYGGTAGRVDSNMWFVIACGEYWMPFFRPSGYGYRFDGLANVMASLLGLSRGSRQSSVDEFIQKVTPDEMPLLPAFHPVIEPEDKGWDKLQMTFSYSFKNDPYHYQNGGLWPMITGFYIADLARRNKTDTARGYLEGIHRANRLEMDGESWSFPEYVHGKNFTAGGTRHQGWSAAAAVIGSQALDGQPMLKISG